MSSITYDDFVASLEKESPSVTDDALQALWYAGKEDWNKAHLIARDIDSEVGYWIHAFLHRDKGDDFNAEDWYERAGKPFCTLSTKEEWDDIVKSLLN